MSTGRRTSLGSVILAGVVLGTIAAPRAQAQLNSRPASVTLVARIEESVTFHVAPAVQPAGQAQGAPPELLAGFFAWRFEEGKTVRLSTTAGPAASNSSAAPFVSFKALATASTIFGFRPQPLNQPLVLDPMVEPEHDLVGRVGLLVGVQPPTKILVLRIAVL